MPDRLGSPGVAIVALHRLATSTEVWVLPTSAGTRPLPCAASRSDRSQWALAEDLLRESGLGDARRLYASALRIDGEGDPLGVFVAFLDAAGPAPGSPGAWLDLREASRQLEPLWSGVLAQVRERFVARPPDEALRVR